MNSDMAKISVSLDKVSCVTEGNKFSVMAEALAVTLALNAVIPDAKVTDTPAFFDEHVLPTIAAPLDNLSETIPVSVEDFVGYVKAAWFTRVRIARGDTSGLEARIALTLGALRDGKLAALGPNIAEDVFRKF